MPLLNYRNISTNPCLNELVYSVLRSADKDELLKLKGRFLKASKSEKAAKFFAANARYEEKATLLAEFGVRFFTVVVNSESVTKKEIKEILDKFEDNKRGSAMADLAELGIWVESDKNFIHLLGLMSDTVNHPSYRLELEYNRAGFHFKKWKTTQRNKHDNNVLEAMESADYFSKVAVQSSLIADRAQVLFGITASQLKILVYLYHRRYTHTVKDTIWNYFLGNFTLQMVSTNLTKLLSLKYVEQHLTAKPAEFTITSNGIGIVNRYMKTILNQINS